MPDEREQFEDTIFPLNGIDLYSAFQQQRPGTTPIGKNVRAFEPSTQRARGGARPGLTEFIQQALPLNYVSGSRKIQHLNYIVDPTPAALAQDDQNDPTDVDDPSTNPPGSDPDNPLDFRVRNRHRKVRKGGSGHQHNRNLPKARNKRRFIQQASVSLESPFGDESHPPYSFTLAWPNPLTASSLLVIALARNGIIDDSDPPPDIADALGTAFTLVGHATANLFNNAQIWLWIAINTHGAMGNSATFTVHPGAFTSFENDLFAVLEYGGFLTSGPLDAAISGVTTGAAWTLGAVPVNAANDMVLGAFGGFDDAGGNTMNPGIYKARSTPTTTDGAFWQGLIVCDHIDVSAAEGPTITMGQSAESVGVVISLKAQP